MIALGNDLSDDLTFNIYTHVEVLVFWLSDLRRYGIRFDLGTC